MATTNNGISQANQSLVMVRATVILRIPDLDASELAELYRAVNEITAKFGGEYNVDTAPQGQGLPQFNK